LPDRYPESVRIPVAKATHRVSDPGCFDVSVGAMAPDQQVGGTVDIGIVVKQSTEQTPDSVKEASDLRWTLPSGSRGPLSGRVSDAGPARAMDPV